jgi:hypothetical protein
MILRARNTMSGMTTAATMTGAITGTMTKIVMTGATMCGVMIKDATTGMMIKGVMPGVTMTDAVTSATISVTMTGEMIGAITDNARIQSKKRRQPFFGVACVFLFDFRQSGII